MQSSPPSRPGTAAPSNPRSSVLTSPRPHHMPVSSPRSPAQSPSRPTGTPLGLNQSLTTYRSGNNTPITSPPPRESQQRISSPPAVPRPPSASSRGSRPSTNLQQARQLLSPRAFQPSNASSQINGNVRQIKSFASSQAERTMSPVSSVALSVSHQGSPRRDIPDSMTSPRIVFSSSNGHLKSHSPSEGHRTPTQSSIRSPQSADPPPAYSDEVISADVCDLHFSMFEDELRHNRWPWQDRRLPFVIVITVVTVLLLAAVLLLATILPAVMG